MFYYFVPGYASQSRLNPDSIHLGGESRLDPNYCASVSFRIYMYMYIVYIEMQNVYIHVHVRL